MEIKIDSLKNALETVKESISILDNNNLEHLRTSLEDAVIKRFEYTLELSKKIMKKILKKYYDKQEEELTVNNIFRLMYGLNFISNMERWRNYHEKRNNTAHEYNLEKSRKLLSLVPEFIQDIEELINNIEKNITEN